MNPPLIPHIITERILQNGYIGVEEAVFLKKQGVTHILNLDAEYSNVNAIEALGLVVHHIFVQDMSPMDDETAIAVVDAMHESLSVPDGRLYVHCDAGLNRSPTAVWLYFLATGLSETEATQMILQSHSHLSAPANVLVTELDLARIKGRFSITQQRDRQMDRHPDRYKR